ncbi:MAG: hypothetical protein KDE27_05170 [Planctomycetes bacterium]|nr:hypothetical protein [Planctomycetota bacterium]
MSTPNVPEPDAQAPLAQLAALAAAGPVVVAHRGDSGSSGHAENTLPAFEAARRIGCAMQEFDVRRTRDGVLVCIHDGSLDRTTDAAARLGPGALVAETTFAELGQLDAGSWHPANAAPAAVPTLAAVLDLLLPACIPLIEHKAGAATDYIELLRRRDAIGGVILQSFDWRFVADAKALAPELTVALLGPTRGFAELDDAAVAAARACGAGMVHWHASRLDAGAVRRAHDAGLLVCSYTTDDELGMRGGAALGIDAMCTNEPAKMLALELQRPHRQPRP